MWKLQEEEELFETLAILPCQYFSPPPLEYEETIPWLVIQLAVDDCLGRRTSTINNAWDRRPTHQAAEAWIFGPQEDNDVSFDARCAEMEISPRRIRRAIRAIQGDRNCPCESCARAESAVCLAVPVVQTGWDTMKQGIIAASLFVMIFMTSFLSSCAYIDASMTPGGQAHVTGMRLFVQSDVHATFSKEGDVTIDYGAKTESDKLLELISKLAPILKAAALAGGVPIP